MPLKDLLKKKEKIQDEATSSGIIVPSPPLPAASEFTFLRTTTVGQEQIYLPSDPEDEKQQDAQKPQDSHRKSRLHFHRPSKSTASSPARGDERKSLSKGEKRLSERLHLGSRSRSASSSSANIPSELPQIIDNTASPEETEAQWERRATILAQSNPNSRPTSRNAAAARKQQQPQHNSTISDEWGDANVQEAIRLHEAGDLERSSAMFGYLANPNGADNALSQVLYGLALRHGWGVKPNPTLAITYLSHAASNSAAVEALALEAGMKKGGAAKGELVLAIFELANSFRNGWGVARDPIAARQYYETAANLGDTDAMNEAGWCYLEGFGGPKDKFKAAQFLRRAEEKGHKTLGNTWIWKEKYNPR